MSWCPDTAKVSLPVIHLSIFPFDFDKAYNLSHSFYFTRAQVKKKMLYSSSFDALKKSLVGVQKYIQATDLSEASQEAVEEKLRATDRQ